jgi:cytochrome c oxidase assembly factor CtaG/putative copper export protein
MHDLGRRQRRASTGRLSRRLSPAPARRVVIAIPGRHPRRALLLAVLGATAVLVAVVTLALTGSGPQPSVPGLPSAGALTGWGLPAVHVLGNLCALGCVGALLVGGVLAPAGGGSLTGAGTRAVGAAASWAAGWAAASALTVLLTVSDVEGAPVGQVLSSGVATLAWALPQTRALLAVAVLAAVVSVLASRTATVLGARWALGVALLAVVPPLYTGHSAHTTDHAIATGSLVVHVLAATAWIGGLLGLALHLRRPGSEQLRAVPRFSALALVCFCAVAGSGVLAAMARLGTSVPAWTSAYGAVLAVKFAAVAGLGVVGWQHRRRTMAALRGGRPGAFWRLATGELLLMAGVSGLAVALSRTAAPTPPAGALLPARLGWWQPDVLAVVVVVVLLGVYLTGVRMAGCLAFVRPGHPGWSRWRTAAAVLAAVVALIATGAPARPSSAVVVTVGVVQLMVLSVVVPVLVALAAPGRLNRLVREDAASDEPGRLTRLLRDPVNAFLLLVAVTAAVWATPLGSLATLNEPLHQVVEGAALVAGTALFRSALEGNAVTGVLAARDRAVLLLVTGGFLTGFAAALATRRAVPGTTAAGAGVVSVDQVLADQHRAAAVLVAVALVLASAALATLLRARQTGDRGKTSPVTA